MDLTSKAAQSATACHPLEFGPVVGQFGGQGIHAWVRMAEGLYAFVGLAPGPEAGLVDLSLLRKDEIAVWPGLLYRLA